MKTPQFRVTNAPRVPISCWSQLTAVTFFVLMDLLTFEVPFSKLAKSQPSFTDKLVWFEDQNQQKPIRKLQTNKVTLRDPVSHLPK